MDPGVAAAAYGVETAIEGGIGAAIAIAQSTMPLKASWKRIQTATRVPRSSHSLSVVKGKAYIFGGEERPREPVSNDIHVFTLPSSGVLEADYKVITPQASPDGGQIPPPRVGHTANVIDDRIYIFGGRGGKSMQPLDEEGRLWVFDTKLMDWNFLDPRKGSSYPEARSYHASTATQGPSNGEHDQAKAPSAPRAPNTSGTIFIHGGCPPSGRVADVWAFDVLTRTWSKFPDAPGPARGGPSLTFTQNRLYRYGGFDGKSELGGPLTYLDLSVAMASSTDQSDKAELALTPSTGKWEIIAPPPNEYVPGDRSVAGLQPLTTGQGRNFLLLFLGEKDPSSMGHEGAGQFWDDVWSYQLQSHSMTAASFKDATRTLVGAKTGEGSWAQVEIPEATMTDGQLEHPGQRGWFASAQGQDLDRGSIVIWGGLTSDNTRAGDGWVLTVDT